MRLRDFVLCLSLGGAGALAREGLHHGATVLRPASAPWACIVARLSSSCVRYVDRNDQGTLDHDYREARS